MIRTSDTKAVAGELHTRYDPDRAVMLIWRLLQRNLFAARPDEVLFWALVYAHYHGGNLRDATEEQLWAFSRFIVRDRSDRN